MRVRTDLARVALALILPAALACHTSTTHAAEATPAAAAARERAVMEPASDEAPVCARVTSPFTGSVCSPADGRRHPAIVLFGGYEPGDPMHRTAIAFAGRGYVAASVVYFASPSGGNETPPVLVDVPVEIGGRALAALAARADVDAARIAVMGVSKGGEYGLLVASVYPAVKAVIANVPSPFALFGLGSHGVPTGCSWSRAGQPLPCVPEDPVAGEAVWHRMQADQPVAFRLSNDASRVAASQETLEAAFFPLEEIRGPVLCLAAADDQTWNSPVHCELAMARLRAHHHPFADRMITYPDAGHLFLRADGGPRSAMNRVRTGSFEIVFGGTPDGDARAAAAAWPQIHAFLDAALK